MPSEKMYLEKSGKWSDAHNWSGGTLPGPNDRVYANGAIVEIDRDIAVKNLTNDPGRIAKVGGQFIVAGNHDVVFESITCPKVSQMPVLLISHRTTNVNSRR